MLADARIAPDKNYYVNIDHTVVENGGQNFNDTRDYTVDSSNGTVDVTFANAETQRRIKSAQMTPIEDLADPFSLPNV